MKKHMTLSFLLLLMLSLQTVHAQIDMPERGFISKTPAATWEEGLISGNGTIGANVFSRPLDETIIFTHERMFLPMGPPTMPPDQSARLFEIRQLIDRGLYKQATELQFNLSGQESFMYPDPFVPVCDLGIVMHTDPEIRNYARSVDFATGETRVHYENSQGSFDRYLFVSRADGLVVMKLVAGTKGSLDCTLRMKRRIPGDKLRTNYIDGTARRFGTHIQDIRIGAAEEFLTYEHSFSQAYPGSVHLVEAAAGVYPQGGRMETTREEIRISGADEVLIIIDLDLSYDPDQPLMNDLKSDISAMEKDYAGLLARHAAIHGELFLRMKLDLGGGSDHALTTEELFAKSTMEDINMALIEKEFDAARYNIISCTGELPPTLQGIWAGTLVPDWASDFTHNGNVPSAIAGMGMGNNPELLLAYNSYIESLVPWMQINAKHLFGCRGIVLPSRSTTNGYNNALAGTFAGGFWVGGAAWAAHFFYDYYLYTGDEAYLRDHALPFMEECALFFEDYLYEGEDGKFIFSPTQSPENTPGNTNSQGTFNATMDVAVAKELFANLITVSKQLGTNTDQIAKWQDMLSKMPDYSIDENGMIKEWLTPRLANNDAHRHSSQLYPLYDTWPEEIAASTELQDAFKNSIVYKLDKHWRSSRSGFMSFGLVQLGQAAAALGEGELAYECMGHLVNRFWLNNMASMHNHKTLFNMDISGGQPAVLIKMLAYSDPGKIDLLPALPKAWPEGRIDGILCRGQVEITTLEWGASTVSAELLSAKNQTVAVSAFGQEKKVKLRAGEAATVTFSR